MGEEGTAMRMVLCETEESRRTYTLNSFGQTISSYEELCYIISDKSEIDLAEYDTKAVEINYKEVSKILL